jgi:transposase InsO family protein
VGPDIGLPTLRAMIPGASRSPLERHLREYRLRHRRRRRAHLHRLTWHRSGSVWAVDLADPPELVDSSGRAILAVRDLASRYTLAWIPLPRGSARHVAVAMARLFRRTGAPLVLKSDNGSCFTAPAFRMLLARQGVVHLRSPRAWPQYNGACEAGIGVLKALADTAAATRGEPDHWTTDDLEEARSRANDLSRRIGDRLVPAREEWSSRRRLRRPERAELRRAIERQTAELKKADPKLRRHPARLRRKAIQGALVDLGLLSVIGRWVRARSTGRGIGPSYR